MAKLVLSPYYFGITLVSLWYHYGIIVMQLYFVLILRQFAGKKFFFFIFPIAMRWFRRRGKTPLPCDYSVIIIWLLWGRNSAYSRLCKVTNWLIWHVLVSCPIVNASQLISSRAFRREKKKKFGNLSAAVWFLICYPLQQPFRWALAASFFFFFSFCIFMFCTQQ